MNACSRDMAAAVNKALLEYLDSLKTERKKGKTE